jgi:hypothetical protein
MGRGVWGEVWDPRSGFARMTVDPSTTRGFSATSAAMVDCAATMTQGERGQHARNARAQRGTFGAARAVPGLFSARSFGSAFSVGSIFSIGSVGSILSIGSAGSILSIGSAGSILSIGSAGSILSIGGAGSGPGVDREDDEA